MVDVYSVKMADLDINLICFYFVYLAYRVLTFSYRGSSWPWSYGSWIYNYPCNQCLSPLMLWVRILIRARCTTLCDKICQWLVTGQWFSPVSSTNKTDRHDIAEILFKVALNTIKQTSKQTVSYHIQHKIKLICRSKCYIFILNNNRRKNSWKRMSKRFPPFILNQIL
jgi:hypothetical protein